MNQRSSTIELSSSFQPEIRQVRVARKTFKKIRYIRNCLLIRATLMVKKCMHENLKHTVIKHLAEKNKKHRISFWHLLTNLKNKYLLEKLLNKKQNSFNIHNVAFFKKNKVKYLQISLSKISMIRSTVPEIQSKTY